MKEIIRFVMLAQSARFTVSELCEQFGISRKTASGRLVAELNDRAAKIRSAFHISKSGVKNPHRRAV